ncbi:MAG: HAD family hydrolase [Bacilli bacterium]
MDKKAIIFDVDGTLWDSTEQITASYNKTLQNERIEKTITLELVCSIMGLTEKEIVAKFFPEFGEEKRLELIKLCCEQECVYLREHGGKLYPNVEQVLQQLSKRFDLYIISNCQDGYIETLFLLYDIGKYFQDYECSGKTWLPKNKNIELIMQRNGVINAVYIGDTQKDKDACIKAKIPFVFASYGFGTVDTYDAKINSFIDLISLPFASLLES